MNLIGNLIWLICGGLFTALGYIFGGILLCITIVGMPFGFQCFKLAAASLAPFGLRIESHPYSGGCLSLFANLLWLVSGGLFTALNHLFWAVVLTLTVVGIPFAKQHLKLLELSMMPFGKRLV